MLIFFMYANYVHINKNWRRNLSTQKMCQLGGLYYFFFIILSSEYFKITDDFLFETRHNITFYLITTFCKKMYKNIYFSNDA